jgi:hypothetical protein
MYITKTHSEPTIEAVELFPAEVEMSFLSTKYLATEAAKQLTYAILHPQPAGPFAQVGDEQMLALQRLVAIFEGALPTHRQKQPPLTEVGKSDTALMVQVAVLLPRLQR